MLITQKKILSLILLLGLSPMALADAPPTNSTSPPPLSNPQQSKAIEFARQAGAIAGIAQACGQNLGDFSARITEAINKLTNDPSEQSAAALVYQRISQEAQMAERKKQSIPCTKVLEDFRNLPIMQSDYKAKVIDQLNPTGP
jgi:ABC-type Fe2+-enterobactin transport system substrate-binding protein